MYLSKNKSLLTEWLSYIQNLNSVIIDLDLSRIREVATILNLIPFNIYTISIGGTNGKGTTCRLLESILLLNNIKVGLYTSPHLLRYHERIRVFGQELSDDIHIQAMCVIEKARHNISLTYFEFITLSALYIFKRFQLDVVILEVGLGGRLDATNIVDPDISVLTNIAIDHIDFLGSTRSSIAIEKSGIFRSNKPAIIGESNYPVIINEIAKHQKTILFVRGRDWDFRYYQNKWCWIDIQNNYKILDNLPFPMIPLENAAIVLSILRWFPLSISKISICYGLKKTIVLGRFQIICNNPLIILDVGHNPHAATYVIQRLSLIVSNIRTVRVVIGTLQSKDINGIINALEKLVDVWYYAQLDTSFSATPEQLFNCFVRFNAFNFDSITNAWKKAVIDSNSDDCILVFGSFYVVSEIIKLFIYNQQFNNIYGKYILKNILQLIY